VAEFYALGCIPQAPSSVKEEIETIAVYPNPSSGKVTIPLLDKHVEHIEIWNASGRLMFTRNSSQSANDVTFDCTTMNAGVYHIILYGIHGSIYRCNVIIQ
ncbi:MAG: T9SS C-terminal target domain-containing protein, partial [Bacteroidetes bacterium]|nr:T9SS C-terminal target domain-containing protein [bacterium]NBP65875.1 T9SS C-terminal target domain-containing protein [Bacteroidota bacterium]